MHNASVVAVSDLPQNGEYRFALDFTEQQLGQIIQDLELVDLTKLSFDGTIKAAGRESWTLNAKLGASVVQSCVITLEPVKTRIDENIQRDFIPNDQDFEEDSVSEMDENVETEPLGNEIDLFAIASEVIALNLPPYPQIPGATLENAVFTEPGKAAMTDDDAKPFASLASLKDKLSK
ncbi:hypothetical protein BFP76_03540 [Amylibacter kogurei]|uniref:50S ribosomal protein L34 n=1 Tax=Paramylibacter kogurei TaxID=1889778 RepID=A0A2G5K6A4_9RHOB|nr:hypothetical protein BFP76_03540 [Amylibacter kogurei]